MTDFKERRSPKRLYCLEANYHIRSRRGVNFCAALVGGLVNGVTTLTLCDVLLDVRAAELLCYAVACSSIYHAGMLCSLQSQTLTQQL